MSRLRVGVIGLGVGERHLEAYARERRLDRQGTIRFTDGLVRLFSTAAAPLRHARGAGLFALDLLPPARHFVAKRMMFGARAWLLPGASWGFNAVPQAQRLLDDQQRLMGNAGAAVARQRGEQRPGGDAREVGQHQQRQNSGDDQLGQTVVVDRAEDSQMLRQKGDERGHSQRARHVSGEHGAADDVGQRAHRFGLALHLHQQATNVGVMQDADLGAATDAGFGALDAVVNVAGISRTTGFATGSDADWRDVLSVHLDGYRNILGAALPLMAAAGRGHILGVTSGSGWRAADAGAYGYSMANTYNQRMLPREDVIE